ncbi:MAG TPA: MerR family transcriptional regulator [Firmicutes bacterium]|nr:MerR family transcriptional regulator [Bacillota bacterium]
MEKKTRFIYIDEVAERTGLTQRTLRFWEEKGLLPSPARSEGGIRMYSDADVSRVIRIRELRDLLGLSLSVIKEIMQVEDELTQVRLQAQQVKREEKLPYLRRSAVMLTTQIQFLGDRIARLQALQSSYAEQLACLRRHMTELEHTAAEQ